MTERSIVAWQRWRDQADKFDYYALGIASALTAYLGQHIVPARLGLNASTLELASLLTLAASTVAGLKRLKAATSFSLAESVALDAQEKAGGVATQLLKSPGQQLIDEESGTIYSHEQAHQLARTMQARSDSAEKQVARWRKAAESTYRWRDRFLIGGVALYGAAKLLAFVTISVA
ncbi:MAG: hypothetical protein IT353_14070 [Gemmatimonadaceae bacterium]|nr:hypothetical protein [Gemmatimonadaceae bacterium]